MLAQFCAENSGGLETALVRATRLKSPTAMNSARWAKGGASAPAEKARASALSSSLRKSWVCAR